MEEESTLPHPSGAFPNVPSWNTLVSPLTDWAGLEDQSTQTWAGIFVATMATIPNSWLPWQPYRICGYHGNHTNGCAHTRVRKQTKGPTSFLPWLLLPAVEQAPPSGWSHTGRRRALAHATRSPVPHLKTGHHNVNKQMPPSHTEGTWAEGHPSLAIGVGQKVGEGILYSLDVSLHRHITNAIKHAQKTAEHKTAINTLKTLSLGEKKMLNFGQEKH